MQKGNIWNIIYAILFAGLVLFLSLMPTNPEKSRPFFFFPGYDKVIHLGMYSILSFLVFNAHGIRKGISSRTFLLWSLLLWSYSILIEFIQHYFVPERSGEISDSIANLLGIILTVLAIKFWYKRNIKS